LGFFGWVFLGGFFNANPVSFITSRDVMFLPSQMHCVGVGAEADPSELRESGGHHHRAPEEGRTRRGEVSQFSPTFQGTRR
jgi:hypothetical protein